MSDQTTAIDVPVIVVPEGVSDERYISEGKLTISRLAVAYRKHKGNPPKMTAEIQGWLRWVPPFLHWLATEPRMTPRIRDRTRIDAALKVLSDPTFYAPTDIADLARAVYDHFEAENWGATSTDDVDAEELAAPPSAPPAARTARAGSAIGDIVNTVTTMRLPPETHPIWGVNGIMHGLAFKPGKRASYVLDRRYLSEKRNPRVFGSNGLSPGDWWPFQMAALFRGAHGASVKGISGDAELGAWSVVVSGTYEDLDRDDGDVVWYSADGSHENEDPERVVHLSNATKSLHASRATGKPVRVLRAAKGRGAFAPSVGIRYDGLYRVVDCRRQRNARGGLYEQFKLVREPGQRPLDDIRMSVPTAKQVHDFNRINERY